MKDDQTEEWLGVIERIMVINLKGRREEDMDELMALLEKLEALNAKLKHER